jgi:protein associated with RNAse G/E
MLGPDRQNAARMITVNSRNYDGTLKRSWDCELIERRGSLLVLFGEFESDVDHADLGRIEKGTISYEYYWLDRWYNIFRFHDPSGTLRNFYCNISLPPQFSGEVLDYVDLDIDVLVWPDLTYAVLDQEDYVAAAIAFDYPTYVKTEVERTLSGLVELIESGNLPAETEMSATSAADLREKP